MSSSSRRVNYAIRPAKNIERKMMRDILLRLQPFGSFSEYQYIGLGAAYYVDFVLFHKSLHIDKMVSIEIDSSNRDRYLFNCPFNSIKVKFGSVADVLPNLDLSQKSIFWLDYDGRFSKSMLSDIRIICEKAVSGSFVSLSFNSEQYRYSELEEIYGNDTTDMYRRKFTELFGEELIPIDFSEKGWTKHSKFIKFIKKNICAYVNSVLSERNSCVSSENQLSLKEVAYFHYADGAKMSTFCFMIVSKNDNSIFDDCRIKDLYFCENLEEGYTIEVPNLTMKEAKYLMEKMPSTNAPRLKGFLSDQDIKNFRDNYRYYPSFSEFELF